MALLCCHNQIQFHLRPCQKGTSVVQTRKLGDRSMTSLQQLCHPPQIHGQCLKAIQRWKKYQDFLDNWTLYQPHFDHLGTWTLERWGPPHSHSLVSVYKAPFQLYHLSDVWMHQTSCFKIIPANQPSEASLERRGNAFLVPSSAPVAEELFLTLKLLTLDGTHRNPQEPTTIASLHRQTKPKYGSTCNRTYYNF